MPFFRSAAIALLRAPLLALALSGIGTQASAVETQFATPGADEALRDRLGRASAVLAARSHTETAVQDILAAALSDYRSLVQVLYDEGYFAPIVSIHLDQREAAAINPLALPKRITNVAVSIETGPKFSLGTARVAPLPAQPETALPAGFKPGAAASTGILRDAAAAGVLSWRQAGHAKAEVARQTITADHISRRLNAQIRLSPGPKLRLGQLQISGDSDVRDDAIRRIAGWPSAQTYHPDLIAKSAERLRRTGAFSSVAFREAEHPSADQTLDVTAVIKDQPKRRLTFGVQLSSSDGIELSGNWMHRNLFGGAERLRFESRLSGIGGNSDIDGRISLRLDRPATFGPDDSTFYLLEVERLDEEHFTALQGLGAIGVRRVYSDTFFGEAALGFSSTLATDAFGKRRFKYALARVKLEQDLRDSRVSATSGTFLSIQATPFLGLDGSPSGVQVTGDARAYLQLSSRLVAAGRLQIGSVFGPQLSEISPTFGFFSGGAGTVRGHEYQSLGIPVGTLTAAGRGFLALSAELRGQVSDKISLVGFYDVGLISDHSLATAGTNQHSGAGIGLRYDIAGIGPLRLDLAFPVSGGSDDGLQFYIGVGQAF